MSTNPDTHAVYWPRGRKTIAYQPVSERLSTLEGKKVAFLWDYLFRGDEIFPMIEEGLAQRFPGVQVVGYETFGSTHGSDEVAVLNALPAKLKEMEVDAVISGMGC